MLERVRTRTMAQREARLAYFLIIPTFAIVIGLIIFPVFFNVWISLHRIGLDNLNDVFRARFVRLDNYGRTARDFAFPDALTTSVLYSFTATSITVIAGLGAGLLLNQSFPGRGLARSIFLIPYIAPLISVAYIWKWLLDPTVRGVVNWTLLRLGLIDEPIAWLGQQGMALVIVILFEGWRYFPFAMLMILARLQAIDVTLYEAASVDGAGRWRRFWHITLPELRYVLGTIFLLRLMWTFNKFDDIFLLTGGGFGTRVLPILTYEFSFKLFDFGQGAATAMFLVVILLVFMLIYIRKVLQW
ncbi:MAG: sugar ABC transporter permease [Spirochaetota bacterium]